MNIEEIIKQQEGRRLEFKENLSDKNRIEKTVVAFSNDAGGEIYIGIKNKPRKIIGFKEDEIIRLEEQISNIIYDSSQPAIIPDIAIVNVNGKYILRITVYPGNHTPFFIKSIGKNKGTYIRVGSSNKPADESIIQELERRHRNISYDSQPSYESNPINVSMSTFEKLFFEQTGKKLDKKAYEKLGLVITEGNKKYLTIASILLSDKTDKSKKYHYAKIECARFKGTTTSKTLDSQTIDESICLQPTLALNFIQRNIKKGSEIEGLYRKERWEYPLTAIREVIINAVIHRDYSQLGRDIKIAIYDDMLEITSPGTLPPSIDINNLTLGLSEIRNRTLAPIFKLLNLIEQWGTGFQKLADELNEYPEIEVKFLEPGLSFQVQFIKKGYKTVANVNNASSPNTIMQQQTGGETLSTLQIIKQIPPEKELRSILKRLNIGYDRFANHVLSLYQVCPKSVPSYLSVSVLLLSINEIDIITLMKLLRKSNRTRFRESVINPLLDNKLISMTIPSKPKSSKQKYIVTENVRELLSRITPNFKD